MRPRRIELEIGELVLPPGWDTAAVSRALREELSARTAEQGISERVAASRRVDPGPVPGIAAASSSRELGGQVGAAIAKGLAR